MQLSAKEYIDNLTGIYIPVYQCMTLQFFLDLMEGFNKSIEQVSEDSEGLLDISKMHLCELRDSVQEVESISVTQATTLMLKRALELLTDLKDNTDNGSQFARIFDFHIRYCKHTHRTVLFPYNHLHLERLKEKGMLYTSSTTPVHIGDRRVELEL